MKAKILLFTISIMAVNLCLSAQSVNKEIENLTCKAYLMNSDIFWNEAIQKSKVLANTHTESPEFQLIYINALYGILYSTLADMDKEIYNKYIDETEHAIDAFYEANPDNGRIICIKSGLYGIKMAYYPWKGMFFGPKSAELIAKAEKLNPELPQTSVRKASSEFFTPEAYGGDIKKSMETYQKALGKFESIEQDLSMNWEYLDALAWSGITQMKNLKYYEAQKTFEKALELQPNFQWIKNVLLPETIRLAENNKNSNHESTNF